MKTSWRNSVKDLNYNNTCLSNKKCLILALIYENHGQKGMGHMEQYNVQDTGV